MVFFSPEPATLFYERDLFVTLFVSLHEMLST